MGFSLVFMAGNSPCYEWEKSTISMAFPMVYHRKMVISWLTMVYFMG